MVSHDTPEIRQQYILPLLMKRKKKTKTDRKMRKMIKCTHKTPDRNKYSTGFYFWMRLNETELG